MQKNNTRGVFLSSLFALCELILSFCVQIAKKKLVKYFAFFSILLAALFAFIFFCDKLDYTLTQTGLVFTVLADLFLVLLESPNKLLPMVFFSVTQLSYFALLYVRDSRYRRLHLTLRLSVIAVALILTVLVLGSSTDALSLISLFYFANLVMNVIWAFFEFKHSRLFAIGLLLFLMCDVCVGLSVLNSSYLPLGEGSLLYFLANPPINLAWVFYVPSQTLVALSIGERLVTVS